MLGKSVRRTNNVPTLNSFRSIFSLPEVRECSSKLGSLVLDFIKDFQVNFSISRGSCDSTNER